MNVSRLVGIMKKYIPTDEGHRQLLEYHVAPVLMRAAKNPEDHDAVQSFMAELKAR